MWSCEHHKQSGERPFGATRYPQQQTVQHQANCSHQLERGTSMIKKLLVTGLVVSTVGYCALGRDMWSYFRTAGKFVHDEVKKEIPLEFELERARQSIEKLMPEIHQSMHFIAEQQVDVEHLNKQIAAREDSVTKQKTQLLVLRSKLDQDTNEIYVSEGKTADRSLVEKDLEQRFSRFKVLEETLKHEHKLLQAREDMLEANRTKLVGMMGEKRELELQLAQLEARLKTIQAAETVSSLALDNSELSRAKQMVADLNKQLDVREKVLAHEEAFNDLVALESEVTTKKSANIENEIDQHFKSGVTNTDTQESESLVDVK